MAFRCLIQKLRLRYHDSTPYGKDVLKTPKNVASRGSKLFFYYSLLDWNRDDYFLEVEQGQGLQDVEKANGKNISLL